MASMSIEILEKKKNKEVKTARSHHVFATKIMQETLHNLYYICIQLMFWFINFGSHSAVQGDL